MRGLCNTKGHAGKPHRERANCQDWVPNHPPVGEAFVEDYDPEVMDARNNHGQGLPTVEDLDKVAEEMATKERTCEQSTDSTHAEGI